MKIIIVDDDCLVAGALKTILEVNEDVEVVATGADGKSGKKQNICLWMPGQNTPGCYQTVHFLHSNIQRSTSGSYLS